jgi:hypothetical protein
MFIDIHAHAYLYPAPPQDGHTQFLIELKNSGKITWQVFNKIARENAIKLFNLPLPAYNKK